jgi:hypothetical protein
MMDGGRGGGAGAGAGGGGGANGSKGFAAATPPAVDAGPE